MYAALHYRNGEIPNESVIKATIDYTSYKDSTGKSYCQNSNIITQCMAELKKTLDEEIKPSDRLLYKMDMRRSLNCLYQRK